MMNSLLKSIGTGNSGATLLKDSLRSHLITSVKEVQLEFSEDGDEQSKSDAANSLCTVLEAIFIHGLKETLADKMAIALANPDQRPEPNFWSPLLVFSHSQIIDQIGELSLVTTDVGRCRTWLRLALNECLLSSYLQSMFIQNDALKTYYKPSAFLRDIELLDIARQLINGVEACEFEFACNSSLLNTWTNTPLLMAGLWTPPMKSLPVSSATDIARTMNSNDDSSKSDDTVSVSQQESLPSSNQSVLFDEDEALKIILGKKHNTETNTCLELGEEISIKDEPKAISIENTSTGTGLKFSENNSVSTSVSSPTQFPIEIGIDIKNSHKGTELVLSPSKVQSYHSLVESYNQGSTTGNKNVDLDNVMKRFHSPGSSKKKLSLDIDTKQVSELGFEVISFPLAEKINEFLGYLPLELGLDSQNYVCKSCPQNIGINFKSSARVCSLTGSYYCDECYEKSSPSENWVIPARIVHNWDFRCHPVSSHAADFLNQIQHHPLININQINPRLYLAVEEMAELQDLRIRLKFLCAYLQLCREPLIEELHKKLWPREYLYEEVHLYSIADLVEIPSGALAQHLRNLISFAKKHVLSCWLCGQKGFICEICNCTKVIYPFEMEDTYRCGSCNSVYHSACLNASKPCPKCKRKSERKHSQKLESIL